MNEEIKKILNLLSEGKIDATQADKLINALENNKKRNKKLRLTIEENGKTSLDLKIPLFLAKWGIYIISKTKSSKINVGQNDFDLSSLDWKEILKKAENEGAGEIFFMKSEDKDEETTIRISVE